MEDIIIRKKDEGNNTWNVEQGNKKSVECGWDEMMGLVAALTMPEERPCLNWMKQKNAGYAPEDGEFVYLGIRDYSCIFIKKDGAKKTECYAIYDFSGDRILTDTKFACSDDEIKIIRPATEEEKNLLLSKLHEIGKDWNADKKEIVDWKWEEECQAMCDKLNKAIKEVK